MTRKKNFVVAVAAGPIGVVVVGSKSRRRPVCLSVVSMIAVVVDGRMPSTCYLARTLHWRFFIDGFDTRQYDEFWKYQPRTSTLEGSVS